MSKERLTLERLRAAFDNLVAAKSTIVLRPKWWYDSSSNCACPMGIWAMGERGLLSPSTNAIYNLTMKTFGPLYVAVFTSTFDGNRTQPNSDAECRERHAVEDAIAIRNAYRNGEFQRDWEKDPCTNCPTNRLN